MSKVADLKNALTELFRKGTEVGYTETEIDEFLEGIDYHTLLQAVWDSAETVYAFRADGRHELSLNYRGPSCSSSGPPCCMRTWAKGLPVL